MPVINGTAGDDTIQDTVGVDTIDGLGGNDTIVSYNGPDTIFGGAGNDQISITRSNDGFNGTINVDGGADNDAITIYSLHASYNVNATGGAGQDDFYVGSSAGAVFLDGGADNDLFRLASDVASATLTLGSGQDVIRFVGGSDGNPSTHVIVTDFAIGDSGDRIDWGSYLQILQNWDPATNPFATGHFQFQTIGSDATLYIDRDGTGGSATLYQLITFQNVSPASLTAYNLGGYLANGSAPVGVTINGTAGDDDLYGAGGNDLINGGDGNDILAGRAGDDEIHGDGGADVIDGELGNDALYGGAGDDRLTDGYGTNSLYGEAGNDILTGSAGLLDGGADDDQLFVSGNGVDARGGTGADRIVLQSNSNGAGTHLVDAGDGDDVIVLEGAGSAGAILGTGRDTIAFANAYRSTFFTPLFVVDDFQTGPGGDRVDLESLFTVDIESWDGEINPFATGHVRLAAGGLPNQVNFYYDRDSGGATPEVLLITFNNVTLASFTADNFSGFAPGSSPVGLNLVGTANGDTLAGGYGNDHIQGLGGNDILSGSIGRDFIEGGDGDDTIAGGFAYDVLWGGAGNDDIDGGANNDVIEGDDGNDRLLGGSGSDQMWGDDGNDDLDGGTGSDILRGGNGDDVLTDDLDSGGDGGLLIGGDGNDILLVVRAGLGSAPSANVTMEGGAGNDVITLQGADQTGSQVVSANIDGGDGDDIIRMIGASASILAGAGNDRVELLTLGQTTTVGINLGLGSDTVVIRPTALGNLIGNRVVSDFKPGDGGDKIQFLESGTGSPFSSWSLVQQGAHTLIRLYGHTVLTLQNVLASDLSAYNFLGFDTGIYNPVVHNITGTSGADSLGGADLDDTISGGDGDDLIFGAGGNDTLNGDGGNDVLQGSSGNDTLNGGDGANRLEGGTGDDTYFLGADVIVERPGEGYDTVYVVVSSVLAADVEIEVFSAISHADTIAMYLTGNAFNQTIIGNNGANQLHGGGGVDVLIGLGGNDIYYTDVAATQVIEAIGGGFDQLYSSVSYVLGGAPEVEFLSTNNAAGTGAINLTGNALGQTLLGNDGVNVLHGGGGADVLVGLGGNDIYYTDVAATQVVEAIGGGNDQLYTSVSYVLGSGEVELLSTSNAAGTAAINLTGNALGQTLLGNDGANVLHGGGGVDVLMGLGGNDIYYTDVAATQVVETAGGGNDQLYTSVSYVLGSGAEVELLSTSNAAGTAALNLTGNGSGQVLLGNAGANVLDGKGGADTLLGLGGADTFAFSSALGGGNVDVIGDFSAADDVISLDDAIFTALGLGALSANAFVIGSAALDADDRIIYNSSNGALFYDADGNGAGAAVQFATLSGAPAITANDFMVI